MLKKMAINIGSVSFVLGLLMVLASLSSVILGRVLDQRSFGEFSLMRTLILFIPPLAMLGEGMAIARFFSKTDVGRYRWDQAFRNIMQIASGLIVLGIAVAAFIYKLEVYKTFALLLAAIAYCTVIFFSNLVRSQRKYMMAIFLMNGFRGFFFIFLVVVFFTGHLTAQSAIWAYVAVILIMALFGARHVFRSIPIGSLPVPREMYHSGLVLLGIEFSVDLLSSLDSLFIPKMLSYEAMGLYAAVLVPGQLFNIITRAGKFVWVPEFGNSKQLKFRKLNYAVIVAGLGVLAILVFAAHPIMHILYNGKYDQGAGLLRVLAVAGLIRLVYGLYSSMVVAKLSDLALKYHFIFSVVAMLMYAFLLVILIQAYGLMGAPIALVLVSLFRLGSVFWLTYHFRHQVEFA